MVTVNEFVEFYNKLRRLYPGRYSDDQETLDTWYSQLNDIPAEYLEDSIKALSDDPTYDTRFAPNAIQLRRIAKRLSGSNEFISTQVINRGEGDDLRGYYYDLLNDFWNDGKLDAEDWARLARELRHRGRTYAASHAEEVYKRLESLE